MTTAAIPSALPRLMAMMFIQYFVWGAWYVTAPNFLSGIGFGAKDFGWTYSVGPIAGMISPFVVGMIADRFFPVQRVLALMHLLGGVIMFASTRLMIVDTPSPSAINWVFFGYMLTFYPTLALTNTLAMRNMADPEKQFPYVRVFGTIGWIAANWVLTFTSWETTIGMFYLTSASAIFLGLYSLTLPNTPPTPSDGPATISQLLGFEALALLKNRSYLIFLFCSVLICIPLAFYYQIASRVVEMVQLPIGRTMSFGQISEIFFMLIMPFFFVRLGVKWMLALGMLAWVVRYGLFAFGAPDEIAWMILAGIILHGICYDFFFVTGQIYTDRVAPKHLRAQAQGLLVLFTLGLGMFIGAQIAGRVEAQHTTEESMAIAVQVTEKDDEIKIIKSQIADSPEAPPANLVLSLDEATAQRNELRHSELAAIDWKPLWLKPCLFAAAVLIIFIFFFRDSQPNNDEEDSASAPES
jgi:nucleoside transporter